MLEPLWGVKTVSAFDVWTFAHILSGISIGMILQKRSKKHVSSLKTKHNHPSIMRFEIWKVLAIAYFWEVIEVYLEHGLAGPAATYWFQGFEFWANRIITDPLMLVVGYFIARFWPRLIIPARVASITFLLVHVFVFPHSMYLHTIF